MMLCKNKNVSVRQMQRRIVVMCFLAYTVSYLCRTNFSIAINPIGHQLNVNHSMLGIIGTMFFWTYAVGQLVSGMVTRLVKAKTMVTIGLSVSALTNLLIGFTSHYTVILILWGINGFALSMIWASLVKLVANWFTPSQYGRISVIISLPTTLGYVLSWGITSIIIQVTSWRYSFFLPAICTAVFVVLWLLTIQEMPENPLPLQPAPETSQKIKTNKTGSRFGRICALFTPFVIALSIVCIMQGAIKESINFWTPTMLQDMFGNVSQYVIAASSILIPLVGTVGILCSSRLNDLLKGREELSLFVLSLALFAFSALMFFIRNNFIGLILSASVVMALLYCINVITTAIVPLKFATGDRAAQLSGTLNFITYLGAALGSSATGFVNNASGWTNTFLLWAGMGLLSLLASVAGIFFEKRKQAKTL